MPILNITRSTPIQRTPRVVQLEGLFDVPPTTHSELSWRVNLPIEERPWQIGLIVGPSGCGKTTLARELFADSLVSGYQWPADRSLVDGFPARMSMKEITLLLSSVGFSSPPAWLRPFAVLSNGEQFRATIARALAESAAGAGAGAGGGLVVIDEFTSVVDRTVAQIGSAAVAKTIRRRAASNGSGANGGGANGSGANGGAQRFVAVTCHDDVAEWLDPDWLYEPATDNFQWRLERRSRPRISLEIARVGPSAWRLFRNHHYLSANLNRTATCFCAFLDRRPVAFSAWLPFVGRLKDGRKARRNHRTVCLPDFQGVGIGQALADFCASLWSGLGYRAFTASGHPGEIAAKNRSPNWRLIRPPSRARGHRERIHALTRSRATNRFTASFEYIGPKLNAHIARRVRD